MAIMRVEDFLKELRQGEMVHCRRSLRNPEPQLIWEVVVCLLGEKYRAFQKWPLDKEGLGDMLYELLLSARRLAEDFKDDKYGKKMP